MENCKLAILIALIIPLCSFVNISSQKDVRPLVAPVKLQSNYSSTAHV